MSIEWNKEIARQYKEDVWNGGNLDLLYKIYGVHSPVEDNTSLETRVKGIQYFHHIAPGLKFTILKQVAEGDMVMLYWQCDLTYSVVPEPPPTTLMPPFGKPVTWKGVDIMRIVDGKIVEIEFVNPWTGMLVEYGVIPTPKA